MCNCDAHIKIDFSMHPKNLLQLSFFFFFFLIRQLFSPLKAEHIMVTSVCLNVWKFACACVYLSFLAHVSFCLSRRMCLPVVCVSVSIVVQLRLELLSIVFDISYRFASLIWLIHFWTYCKYLIVSRNLHVGGFLLVDALDSKFFEKQKSNWFI